MHSAVTLIYNNKVN